MGVINCELDEEPFCSGGVKYCCQSYLGGRDYRPCGNCGVVNCNLTDPPYCDWIGTKYCCQDYLGGRDFVPCGTCTTPTPCTEPIILECWDGSTIVTRDCIGGEYVDTENYCPEQPMPNPNPLPFDWKILAIGGGLVVALALMLKK